MSKAFPIPNQLKIGPFSYKVKAKKKVYNREGVGLYGKIVYRDQAIEIAKGHSCERTTAILLHEALHGLDEAIGIGLTEKQVTKLGVALAGFLLDNDLLRTEDTA